MRREVQLGLTGGLLVSLLSWSGNTTPHFVSIFPNGVTLIGLVAFFLGVVRVQRRDMGSADLETTIRRILPVGVVCGLLMAAAMVLLGVARFSRFGWMLGAFGAVGAFVSCILWALLAATASWVLNDRMGSASQT